MKVLPAPLLILLFVRSATAQVPKATPTPRKDECSVAGMVVKLAGSEPLRKARVRLQSLEDRTHAISTVTDAGGRFQLKGVDPGRYSLTVSRVGFVTQTYGQRKADDPGAALTLHAGQEMKDLLFRLIPSAVIAGRILDEDGEPMPSATVSALREMYAEGKRSLSTSTTVETNDLGEYRLFGLQPGRYFISAVNPRWDRFGTREEGEDRDVHQQGYAKMYYPGTPDAARAASIAIKAGEEIPSVEILMREVLVYRIRGHVYNQITHKPGTGTNIFLTSKANRLEWEFGRQQVVAEKQDASFEIPDVLPGSYLLTALWFDEGKTHEARVSVEVGNADVEGVALTIAQGASINGQIIWDGQPALEKDELTVIAAPADLNFSFGYDDARVNQANSFTLKNIGEGTYHADVAGQSKDCYVKDVQYGGSSALEDGFSVGRGSPASLEITISSHGARIQGTVADADGLPAVGVWVALVPDAAHRAQYRLYKTQTTDQYGHFDLRGVTPGEYKLFSWEEAESDAWEDPEFLKPFEDKGEKISMREGSSKSVALTAIKTASTEQQKP
jgi:protocatechuate 3,4-dioxygenase beta subunit